MMRKLALPGLPGVLYLCPADGTEQMQHDAAHAMLREALAEYTEEKRIRIPDPLLVSEKQKGKPYYPALPEVHFNLSHCAGMAACLLAERECGVDVEHRRPLRPKVVRRVFSPEEQAALEAAADPDMLFTRLWTLKESYVKAIGIGVSYPMQEVCFALGDDAVRSNREDADFWHFTEGDFSVSVCCLRDMPNGTAPRGDRSAHKV